MVHSYVNLVDREEAGEEVEEEDDNDNDEEEEEADEVLHLIMYSPSTKFDLCYRNIGPTLHF